MSNLIKNEQLFGDYNKINKLILRTKQSVIKNINTQRVELYFEIGTTISE